MGLISWWALADVFYMLFLYTQMIPETSHFLVLKTDVFSVKMTITAKVSKRTAYYIISLLIIRVLKINY